MSLSDEADEAMELARSIYPMLKGKEAPVVGAALADLLSMWLAAHTSEGDDLTAMLREELLERHIEVVRALIPVSEPMIRGGRDE